MPLVWSVLAACGLAAEILVEKTYKDLACTEDKLYKMEMKVLLDECFEAAYGQISQYSMATKNSAGTNVSMTYYKDNECQTKNDVPVEHVQVETSCKVDTYDHDDDDDTAKVNVSVQRSVMTVSHVVIFEIFGTDECTPENRSMATPIWIQSCSKESWDDGAPKSTKAVVSGDTIEMTSHASSDCTGDAVVDEDGTGKFTIKLDGECHQWMDKKNYYKSGLSKTSDAFARPVWVSLLLSLVYLSTGSAF